MKLTPRLLSLLTGLNRNVSSELCALVLGEYKWLTYQGTNIDKSRCIQWVGSTYLEAMAPSAESALGRSEFLNAWKDNLPEAWTKEVTLSKLPVSHRFLDRLINRVIAFC